MKLKNRNGENIEVKSELNKSEKRKKRNTSGKKIKLKDTQGRKYSHEYFLYVALMMRVCGENERQEQTSNNKKS